MTLDDDKDLNDIRRAAFDLRTTDPSEAVRILRRVVRKKSGWEALAHGALGEILLDDFEDLDGALHHYEKLFELAPALPMSSMGLARTYQRMGRTDDAQEAYARTCSRFEESLTPLLAPLDAGEPAAPGIEEGLLTMLQAAVEEREMLVMSPSNRRAATPPAALLDRAEAGRVFDLEGDEGEFDAEDWGRYALLRGTLLAMDGLIDEALAVVDRVAQLAPLPAAHRERIRSIVHEAHEDWEEAAEALANSVDGDLSKLEIEDSLRMAVLLTGADSEDGARQLLEKLKTRHPDDEALAREIDRRIEHLPKPSLVTLIKRRRPPLS